MNYLDSDVLCFNIHTILSKECVHLKKNDVIRVEIPGWDMKYDVTMNGKFENNKASIKSKTEMSNLNTVKKPEDKPESKLWTSTGIKLFIENRSTFEDDFNSNKKNYKIWEKIADKLCKNGVIVSGSNCNVKFKNLMATFRDNIHRANTSGDGGISWEYYPLMKKYFGKKNSVAPKKSTLLESFFPNSKPNLDDSRQVASASAIHDENLTDTPPTKKKKTFHEVLLEEMKEDRKNRDEFQKKLENFKDMMIKIENAKLDKMT
ncbi:Trihelix transcription factor GT-1 [Aphis craccivora]|uniref:Trihelix transcription factor GT-1 n=1 Tax=Aphis craccivora TaxID=307492 RepID=A0A6G0W5D2_APHCR|nr:Trihelix transcription factor GT-1 [Aphis craccivora]